MKISIEILLSLFLISCVKNKESTSLQKTLPKFEVQLDTLNLFDKQRNRIIPVAFYFPKTNQKIENQKVVILSHGYSENRLGANKSYSYLTENLASKGYFVVSIQHELPTDDLIPKTGIIKIVRLPFWKRGTENILFVLN